MGYRRSPPASFQLSDFRFTVADYDKLLPLAGVYDATDPDLSAFRQAGGRLIMYQGWADEKISPFGTVDYYKAVVQHAGGFTASQAFTRLYMIPSQYHCLNDGSPAVDAQQATGELLDSLTRWVEQGTAPGAFSLLLAQPAAGRGTRPQHPVPLGQPVPARRRTVVRHPGHGPDLQPPASADQLYRRNHHRPAWCTVHRRSDGHPLGR